MRAKSRVARLVITQSAGTGTPACLAYDTFTRDDGAIGSTEATGPEGQALAPIAWEEYGGTGAIIDGECTCTVSGSNMFVVDVGTADVDVSCTIPENPYTFDEWDGVTARYVGADFETATYLVLAHDGSSAYLGKFTDGEYAEISSIAAAFVASAPLRLVVTGTAATIFYNGVQLGTATVPASVSTKHGLYTNGGIGALDNFLARPA